MGTIQCTSSEELSSEYLLPRQTEVETKSPKNEIIKFQTTRDIYVYPLEVEGVQYYESPEFIPETISRHHDVGGVIQIQLHTTHEGTIAELSLDKLSFFIGSAVKSIVPSLFELLATQVLGVGVAASTALDQVCLISEQDYGVGGFNQDDNVLVYPDNVLPSYRFLTEFFVYHEKYLYFDCENLSSFCRNIQSDTLCLSLFIKQHDDLVAKRLTKGAFKLFCSPVVNLFRDYAEPIYLDHRQFEYPLTADKRNPDSIEVHSITSMEAVNDVGEAFPILPMYGTRFADEKAQDNEKPLFWTAKRIMMDNGRILSSLKIALSNHRYDSIINKPYVINTEVLCTNGNLPASLPFSQDEPKLQFTKANDAIASIKCIKPMTQSYVFSNKNHANWRLISHLTTNNINLFKDDGDPAVLRSWLSLYDSEYSQYSSLIKGITKVTSCRATKRCGEIGGGFFQGTQVDIEFDRKKFSGQHLFLFAMVLDHFFSRFANLNAFTQLNIHTLQEGLIYSCSPRSGQQPIL